MQEYLDGIYRITPFGEHTAFECIVHKTPAGYVLIDLETNESCDVTQELLSKLQPQFQRKEHYESSH